MKDLHLAEPNWEAMYEATQQENRQLKEELAFFRERHTIMETEEAQLRETNYELEKEKLFLSGQVEAFKYCAKGGAE